MQINKERFLTFVEKNVLEALTVTIGQIIEK